MGMLCFVCLRSLSLITSHSQHGSDLHVWFQKDLGTGENDSNVVETVVLPHKHIQFSTPIQKFDNARGRCDMVFECETVNC